MILDKYS
jgi:ATP-binding cassette, subfamily B (MDR/TAP), member 1